MKPETFFVIALTVVTYVVAGAGIGAVFAENIDPYDDDSQYAYGENIGWLNFEPNQGPGVTVSDSNLVGYVWAENIGWLNLWPAVYGGVFNDGNGLLSGDAWSENVGWINFDPIVPGDSNHYGVTIDACGDFNGLAWGENIGWINFGSDGTVFYRLTSDWVSPIDTIAPETFPDIEIPEWFNTNVNLTLSTTDCGSGTVEVHYTLDGDSEVVLGSSASLNITGDGVHTLTYFSVDEDGNIETVSEVIIRIDTTPPVIMLNGPAAMTLECGVDSYTEPDATATDAQDPDVAVVIGGDMVNYLVCGTYNVTYDAVDFVGNAAVQVIRAVTVQDTIAPAISITSPDEGAIYYVDEVILADFAVSDGGSGIDTITATVPSGSSIDTATEGAKTFTVSATDNASNINIVSHWYAVVARGNIDPCDDDSQYAYGENIGWLNFEPNQGPGVTAGDSNLAGYIWAENIGWLNLSPASYGGVFNDGNGVLSGYAWSENAGWLNFNPNVPGDSTHYGVTIDSNGIFDGWAWGENIGWIHLRSETPIVYKVQSAWSVPNLSPVAVCRNVTVSANSNCEGIVMPDDVNDGSYDPDGDMITLSLEPAGPYPLGQTAVTLTVSDSIESATCSAIVTVVDTTPPVFTAIPAPMTVECDGVGNLTELDTWLASVVAKDECGNVTISNNFTGLSDDCGSTGSSTVTWTAVDECGNSVSASSTFTIEDTTAPVIELIGNSIVTVECHTGIYAELGATALDQCDTTPTAVVIGSDVVDVNTPGSYVVTYDAVDDCGNNAAQATRIVNVVDTTPPVVSVGDMVEIRLPNHKYHTFNLSDFVVSVEDNCGGSLEVDVVGTIISVYSDEPEDARGGGDGRTVDDIVILSPSSFKVRAERAGRGNGRVYGITFEVVDAYDNSTVKTCFVGVPHDASGDAPVNDGAAAGYIVP